MDAGQHDGAVAGVVSGGGGVLLVGTVLLLIYDDQVQVAVGKEQGRTGADQEMGAFGAQGVGDLPAAGGGLLGMEDQGRITEPFAQAGFRFFGQRDLRDEKEGCAAFCKGFGNECAVGLKAFWGAALQKNGFAFRQSLA